MRAKRTKPVHSGHHHIMSSSLLVFSILVIALMGALLTPSSSTTLSPTGASFLDVGYAEAAWRCSDGVAVHVLDKGDTCRSMADWNSHASLFCTLNGQVQFSQPCVIKASCTDSDGGIQYYIAGTAVGYDKTQSRSQLTTVSDRCVDQTILQEWSCDSGALGLGLGVLRSTTYDCSNGCVNGVCVQSLSSLEISNAAFFRKTEHINSSTFPSTRRSDAGGAYWLLSSPALDTYDLWVDVLGNGAPMPSHYTLTLVSAASVSYVIGTGDLELPRSDSYSTYNLLLPLSGWSGGMIPQTAALADYTLQITLDTKEADSRHASLTQRVKLSR